MKTLLHDPSCVDVSIEHEIFKIEAMWMPTDLQESFAMPLYFLNIFTKKSLTH